MDFHMLYERHAADVNRFALYLSGDVSMAEDITSETFVRAWTGPARIRSATVKAYLFTIARNLYLHSLRKNRRHTELDDRLPDPAPDAQMRADHREELDRVLSGLQQLPEVDRAALLMRAQQELSFREIAAILGITSVAARVKVHRARLKLARLRHNQEVRKWALQDFVWVGR